MVDYFKCELIRGGSPRYLFFLTRLFLLHSIHAMYYYYFDSSHVRSAKLSFEDLVSLNW